MEQSPRQQNELRLSETKVEVVRERGVCVPCGPAAHLRLEGL